MSKAAELANLIGNINAGGGGVNRNVIINGAMNVAQRGTSSTGIGASTGYFTCDRWFFNVGSTAGRLTMTQDSSAPSGFANSLKVACTTADTSIAAGEAALIMQRIEGQNLQAFAKGTSDAKPFAVSFYVKGNASATYACELFDRDNTRQASKLFNVTTDWTRVELSFPADTTGAFADDNETSLDLAIFLHAGSTFTSGTLNQTFASSTNANRAVGISSFFDSTDRTFFITGVQLEVGQNPTEFEHEPFAVTLDKCERYYMRTGINGGNGAIASGYVHTSSEVRYSLRMRKEMRSAPSLAFVNTGDFLLQDRADNRTPSSFAAYSGKDFTLIVAGHSGGNVGEGSNLLSGGSSEIQCYSEL
tara:strand:+ start:248 stop:1330 length:1083 start_codon:yes stop_codon:yes gene_type:complete